MKLILVCIGMLVSAIASAQKPLSASQWYARAEEAYDKGDYKTAVHYLDQCVALSPGYNEAYFMRGGAREQLKDVQGAHTDYSIFLERQIDHREGLFNRGVVGYQLKLYDQAREDFLRLLRLPNGITQTVYFNRSPSASSKAPVMTAESKISPLIYNYLGMIDLKQNRYQEAIHWLDSAIGIDPKDPAFYTNRALAKQSVSDTVGALKDFQQALKLNPQHTAAIHNLSVLKQGKSIDEAIESDPRELPPYLERAHQRLISGNNRGALEDFTKALELDDRSAETWFSRGLAKERLQDLQGAFSDYTQAIELKEDHFKAWINRANVLLKMKRYEDAIEDYSVALVYRPDYAAAYYNRAIARHYLKALPEACRDLTQAERLGMKVDGKMKEQFCKDAP